ncbi:MAG: single-stranded DNA-binding protein [Candidatus Heteroscillospira sp.]|jgi:single-strand DNA-binding protein
MDYLREANRVELCGTAAGGSVFSHVSRDVEFYTFPLEVARLSGNIDRLNIIVRRELLEQTEVTEADCLTVLGELRSFNNKSDVGNRLVITVYAREIIMGGDCDCNHVWLTGTLCKKPNLRTTPMGRDICDLMLAVNRHYGRSDYLPCIAWGSRAREAAAWDVGTVVSLEGRIQSRRYIKTLDGVPVEKTAFEVSVTELEQV